ncbi:MAG: hypothetical protein JWO52_4118 [Gammaproteobacteria bacterium]|nr:hypothetical protein [Gammaproteobacteria bacterium]
MTTYLCRFEFDGRQYVARTKQGHRTFSEGFWIDANYQFTMGLDGRFWIPPHKISHIEAIRQPESEEV